jgi:hypothetical protein
MKKFYLFIICCCLIAANLQAQTTRYVKTGGTAASEAAAATSWGAACEDLQAVINASSAGDEIWVAAGTYVPNRQATDVETITAANRNNAFVMKAGVKVYGGFADGDNDLLDRVLSAGPTSILSGDFNGDDTPISSTTVPSTMNENAYHVVIFANDAGTASVLDGFVVKGGYANGSNITVNSQTINGTNGGGIHIVAASPILTNLIIQNNAVTGHGAGICNMVSSTPIITNVLIYYNTNSTTYPGGGRAAGIRNDASSPILTNVTITNNYTGGVGGGMANNGSCNPQIRNSIIVNNGTGSSIASYGNGNTYMNTFTDGLSGYGVLPTGVIEGTDPLFEDASAGDYRLSGSSPCINAGDKIVYGGGQTPDLSGVLTDLLGAPRFYNGGEIDLGAYEFQSDPVVSYTPDANGIIYVTESGTGDGSSWANAAGDLADVLSLASTIPAIEQIWVAAGTYKPQVMAGNGATDRDKAFVLAKNIKVYGGFAGTETQLTNRVLSTANASILSGDLNGDDNGESNLTENAYHVVISAGDIGTAVLDGFTISGGNANGSSSITVNSQYVERNYGGGISIYGSNPMLSNLKINKNTASNSGGGIYNGNSSASVLTNILITENKATTNGGGIYNSSSAPYLTNITISGNLANNGSGLYNSLSAPQIRNSIIYGNGSSNVFAQGLSKPSYSHSLVAGSSAGWTDLGTDEGGNIDANPFFTDAAAGDFTLKETNCAIPCINAGDNTFFDGGETPDLSSITTDLAGNTRKTGTIIDMGAYESSVATTYTISGKVIDTVSKNPMAGVTISYCTDANVLTDANGTYSIKVLPNANVTLTASKDGYLVLTEPIVCSNVTSDLNDQDFNIIPVPMTVSGKITLGNGDPLASVYVWYNNRAGAVATKADGTYEITIAPGSNITIEPEMTGYTFTPATRTINNITKDSANNNFTAAKMYTISGTLTFGSYSSAQRIYYTINSGAEQNTETDAGGNYSITVEEGSDITIVPPTRTFYTLCEFLPASIVFEDISQNYIDQDFAAMDSVKGIVTFNDSPLANVTITYDDELTATTDANGIYSIMVPFQDTITLTPSMSGYRFNPENILLENIMAHKPNQNFTAVKTQTISGIVTLDEAPFEGVTITYGTDLTTTTNASGEYSITVNYGADVTITPTMQEYTFTPVSLTIEGVVKDSTGNDFVGEKEEVGNDNLKADDNVRLYPNPTSGVVNIDNPDNLQVSVYTFGGKLVLKTIGNTVDLSGYAKGIYIFKIGNKNVKVVKE